MSRRCRRTVVSNRQWGRRRRRSCSRTTIPRARCTKRRIGVSRVTQRRTQRDYGYWYMPSPRNAAQRTRFFHAEADVQALEAVFAQSCGVRFVVSADDFDASPEELERFEHDVMARLNVRRTTLPSRARTFRAALAAAFGPESVARRQTRIMAERVDCVVIGAGVVGLACARALARDGREVLVLERHGQIGTETSSRNSEVIHAGIYYDTGSLKAQLCVRGKALLYDTARSTAYRSNVAARSSSPPTRPSSKRCAVISGARVRQRRW